MRTALLSALAGAVLALPAPGAFAARPMVAAGYAFSTALDSAGRVWQWGNWYCSSMTNTWVPELVPGLDNIIAIAPGNNHLVALRADNTVWTMGSNSDGQLGRGAIANTCTPAAVPGLAGVTAIAAASFTSYAVMGDGTLRSWGDSLFGALGAVTAGDRNAPGAATVITNATGVAASNSGGAGYALRATGSVASWGDNLRYQLGFITAGSSTSTAGTVGSLGSARRVAAGSYHAAASRSDGAVLTWGWDANGELGAGTVGNADRSAAGLVPNLTGVAELAAGQYHTLAVRYDGSIWTWGDGFWGELGTTSTQDRSPPMAVAGLPFMVQASGGAFHSLALAADGSAWSWGYGFDGALGNNDNAQKNVPVRVLGAGGSGFLALGASSLSIPSTDTDGDGIPDLIESAEGRSAAAKDNDIFAVSRLFAMQQYRDFLGREGDAGGISFYTGLLNADPNSRAPIIEAFFSSPEFSGSVSPIVRLYFAFFNRIPDYAGLQFQVNAFRAGTPLTVIANNFSLSPEFVATYGSLTDTQYVTLLYQNVLGRGASQPEIDFHVARLAGGVTRGEVMTGFSESPEYQGLKYNSVYVTMMYVGMLRRSPEQAGFDYWVAYMAGGNPGLALIAGFLNAPEYRARFLP